MKIRRKCNSLIQLTMLAQQICHNGCAMIPLKHANSTLKGGGKKKRTYPDPNQLSISNGMEISQTTT